MPHSHKDIGNIDMVGRMIRAAGQHVAQYDPDQLARLAGLRAILEDAIAEAVIGQKRNGLTWESVGAGLGVTRQAVIIRYGEREREAS